MTISLLTLKLIDRLSPLSLRERVRVREHDKHNAISFISPTPTLLKKRGNYIFLPNQ